MPEGVDERTFDEDEWSFGEQQFASGELLRKNIELERLLGEEKRRSESIKEREEKKWSEQVEDLKQKADDAKDHWRKLEEDRKDYFKRIHADLAQTRDALDEADNRYYEVMDELLERDESDEITRALFDEHEDKVQKMYYSLLAQAQVAEERWLMVSVVFQFMVDQLSAGKGNVVNVHDLELTDKATLIHCKDVFLYNGALPIWHESFKKQLEGRTAREILASYFKCESPLRKKQDESP